MKCWVILVFGVFRLNICEIILCVVFRGLGMFGVMLICMKGRCDGCFIFVMIGGICGSDW